MKKVYLKFIRNLFHKGREGESRIQPNTKRLQVGHVFLFKWLPFQDDLQPTSFEDNAWVGSYLHRISFHPDHAVPRVHDSPNHGLYVHQIRDRNGNTRPFQEKDMTSHFVYADRLQQVQRSGASRVIVSWPKEMVVPYLGAMNTHRNDGQHILYVLNQQLCILRGLLPHKVVNNHLVHGSNIYCFLNDSVQFYLMVHYESW